VACAEPVLDEEGGDQARKGETSHVAWRRRRDPALGDGEPQVAVRTGGEVERGDAAREWEALHLAGRGNPPGGDTELGDLALRGDATDEPRRVGNQTFPSGPRARSVTVWFFGRVNPSIGCLLAAKLCDARRRTAAALSTRVQPTARSTF